MFVLIVEADAQVARSIETFITAGQSERVTAVTVSSREEAMFELDGRIDFAVLNVLVTDGETFDVARALTDWDVPLVFISASEAGPLPDEFRSAPLLQRPLQDIDMQLHMQAALA